MRGGDAQDHDRGRIMNEPTLTCNDAGEPAFVAAGDWTAAHSALLDRLLPAVARTRPTAHRVAIDVSRVENLDTLGAWLLESLARFCRVQGQEPILVGVPD